MNNKKEKSAVGMAVPATEKDINIITENIISADEEKIKSYSENMTAILDSLSKTLRLTREGRKIKSIVPVTVPMQNSDYIGIYARITYSDGTERYIEIGADSGVAVVYDVAKTLTFS